MLQVRGPGRPTRGTARERNLMANAVQGVVISIDEKASPRSSA